MTYGAPVWAGAANINKNNKTLKRAERTALCITTTAYRTVSHVALCVLTDNLPIHMKVKLLRESYVTHRTRIGVGDDSAFKDKLKNNPKESFGRMAKGVGRV